MSGTNWAAKYKGMSTPHRKDAQKDTLERLQGLMTSLSLGEIKTAKSSNPVDGLSDWLATSEEDSEDSRMDATTSLPLVFAAEKEIAEIEKEIKKQLSSAVGIGKTMLVQTGAPKSAWYKAEGTPAGSRIVYEGESQAEVRPYEERNDELGLRYFLRYFATARSEATITKNIKNILN